MREPTTAGEVMLAIVRGENLFTDTVIPRCYLPGWEADLLIIKRSGWAEEIEIKVSASDFRAEWMSKAAKHEDLQQGAVRCVGHTYWGETTLQQQIDLDDPLRVDRGHRVCIRDQQHIIRRFSFAMPLTLAERLMPEVPEHYGVIGVSHFPKVLRAPKNLKHARKVTDEERIRALTSTYSRFWQLTFRQGAQAVEALSTLEGSKA